MSEPPPPRVAGPRHYLLVGLVFLVLFGLVATGNVWIRRRDQERALALANARIALEELEGRVRHHRSRREAERRRIDILEQRIAELSASLEKGGPEEVRPDRRWLDHLEEQVTELESELAESEAEHLRELDALQRELARARDDFERLPRPWIYFRDFRHPWEMPEPRE